MNAPVVPTTYVKKRIPVEAFRWTPERQDFPAWFVEARDRERGQAVVFQFPGASYMLIRTLEGRMRVDAGSWIVRGVKGELYAMRADVFEATYEAAGPNVLLEAARKLARALEDVLRAPMCADAEALDPEDNAAADAAHGALNEWRAIAPEFCTRSQIDAAPKPESIEP